MSYGSNRPLATATERTLEALRFPGLDDATNFVWEQLARVARSNLPVLILGETGTGKELAAEWVSSVSSRSRLLKINCAGLSESVIESELFGHERGAFTGAHLTRAGIFEAADGGTLFLDEIAELPMSAQAKLLRTLESGEIVRLGSTQARKLDVRIIAATHRNLPERIGAGLFREDLYYRLNGFSATIPPLRARRCEILPLARFFVERSAANSAAHAPRIHGNVEQLLGAHDWPGNVRELRYVMERALALCEDNLILPEHLDIAGVIAPGSDATLRGEVEDFERNRITAALEQTHGNQTRAAKVLGISRRTLTNKLNAYRLPRPRKRRQ